MIRARPFLVLVCAGVTLGACSTEDGDDTEDTSTSSTTSRAAEVELGSTSWVLTGWSDGAEIVESSSPAGLEFATDGQVSGSTGCNSFTGTWEAGQETLSVDLGPLTLAGCVDPVVADQEQAVISALQTANSFEGGVGGLRVLDGEGNLLLEYEAVSEDLAGTSWQATGINNGNGGVEATPNASLASITFSTDGTASGSGGCNTFTAAWDTEGEAISIGELAITEMSCGEDLDAMEQALVAALAASETYSVSGTGLELRDGTGALQVSWEPAPE